MESALRQCYKGIKLGKILVKRHHGQQPSSRATSGGMTPAWVSPLLTPTSAAAAAAAAAAATTGAAGVGVEMSAATVPTAVA